MRKQTEQKNEQNKQDSTHEFYKVSEIKLSYSTKFKASERPQIKSSETAYQILKSVWGADIGFVEEFKILLLNRANRVLGIVPISKGGIAGTVVDAKVIFSAAILSSSTSLILCHNHPSGNLNPSQADLDITKKLKKAGELLDIAVLDHLILTPDNYYSMADNGVF